MIEKIRRMDEKKLTKAMTAANIFFIAGCFLIAYLGGNHDYITFETGIWLFLLFFLPALAVMILMYIRGDAQTRRSYLIRIVLAVVVFGGLNLYRFYMN
ncbi:hypothetical protein ACTHPH_04455 [Paenibacillus pasadenensis]|uniref:Uncharacterized protein n=1 Tax=Paenibacillus pasadenensis TaxID=217090 RepID=A0A2N5N1W3_9BACL|nr:MULTISPECIES: hypothetical protein [Paenibacillus]PLT44324.1 hypothetical protein B8V81_2755 [Paenibacillus pasadenensis]QGG54835.1 hypothetical protein GE073_04030 [Paenibacillus sp. B01]